MAKSLTYKEYHDKINSILETKSYRDNKEDWKMLNEYMALQRKALSSKIVGNLKQAVIHLIMLIYNFITFQNEDNYEHWKEEIISQLSDIPNIKLKGGDLSKTVESIFKGEGLLTSTVAYNISLPKLREELKNNSNFYLDEKLLGEVCNYYYNKSEYVLNMLKDACQKEDANIIRNYIEEINQQDVALDFSKQ